MNKKMIGKMVLVIVGSIGMSINTYASTYGVIKVDTPVVSVNDTSNTVLGEKLAGDFVHIIEKKDDNYKIKLNNQTGFIKKDKIEVTSVIGVISQNNASLRNQADPNGWIEKSLDKGTIVSAHYKCGNWYYVKSTTAEGFVYKSQIKGDNLSLLENQSINKENQQINKAPVENLDWWKSARYAFPRGAVALIEDVYTGKTFQIKRTFGTNHADVEALTAQDTAIIKSIWGGFSWERRPIIVNINGRRIAASMAAMPHAGKDSAPALATTNNLSGGYGRGQNLDMVKGNNMDGVMDLHFLNSMRHKDGKIQAKVDPAHQNAIKIAAKAK